MAQFESEQSESTCACGGNCSCHSEGHSQEVYLTREDYVARLEQYLVDLKAEVESVEKELADLKTPAGLAE